MSELSVLLESIMPCFQGVIPSWVATCSADGVPNATIVSIVHYVDSERVEQHVGAFTVECGRIGIPPEIPKRISERSALVLIRVSIGEGFDQTPGPTAGRRL